MSWNDPNDVAWALLSTVVGVVLIFWWFGIIK